MGRSSSEQIWTDLQWWPSGVSSREGEAGERVGKVVGPRSHAWGRVDSQVPCPGEGVRYHVTYPIVHLMLLTYPPTPPLPPVNKQMPVKILPSPNFRLWAVKWVLHGNELEKSNYFHSWGKILYTIQPHCSYTSSNNFSVFNPIELRSIAWSIVKLKYIFMVKWTIKNFMETQLQLHKIW